MVVALVPALEEQALVGALDDVEPEHLRVVGGGELEVRDADVDVRQAEDPHAATGTDGVPHPGKMSRIAERRLRSREQRRHRPSATLGSVANAARVLKAFTPPNASGA